MIPDVVSLNIDDARKMIYIYDKNLEIVIKETANKRNIKFLDYRISDTIVIKQQLIGITVELTVAYTALQLQEGDLLEEV